MKIVLPEVKMKKKKIASMTDQEYTHWAGQQVAEVVQLLSKGLEDGRKEAIDKHGFLADTPKDPTPPQNHPNIPVADNPQA